MAGNELKMYKIFQRILNIILQMLNLASSLKNTFFKVRVGNGEAQICLAVSANIVIETVLLSNFVKRAFEQCTHTRRNHCGQRNKVGTLAFYSSPTVTGTYSYLGHVCKTGPKIWTEQEAIFAVKCGGSCLLQEICPHQPTVEELCLGDK